MDSGSETPVILPIPGISARNDSVPVLRHPKIFVITQHANMSLPFYNGKERMNLQFAVPHSGFSEGCQKKLIFL